jgi:hypothetical protein
MTDLARIKLKRCPGYHVGTYASAPHQLPATTEYFHVSRYQKDGLNGMCKACNSAYGKYSRKVWNEERAQRKANNIQVAQPLWAKVAM